MDRAEQDTHLGVRHGVGHAARHEVEVHLLAVAADDQVDVGRRSGGHGMQRMLGQHIVADHGQEAAKPEPRIHAVRFP